jgi:hypothetical protein
MADRTHDEWEKEDVEVTKPVGTVVSVRLSEELAETLFGEAQRRGLPTSAVVRAAIDEYLSRAGTTAASLDVTISSANVPVAFYAGRSSLGRTASSPSSIELESAEPELTEA